MAPGCADPCQPGGRIKSPDIHQIFEESTPELCSGVHQKGCDLEGAEGATPHTSLLKAMSTKSLFVYTLFLTLGIGSVTNAKASLIEQAPQPQEAAQIAKSYRPGGVRHKRHRMRPSFSHAPNAWHYWLV